MGQVAQGGLDIKTIRILVLLITERSVTRTAELTGLPQPTISLHLKRLRDMFGDPLLVRHGNSLVPTARGGELATSLARILEQLDQVFEPPEAFQPGEGRHHFKLLMANCFGPSFLPRIISRIRAEAPQAVVDVYPMPAYDQITPLIADGTVSLALGNWPRPPDTLRQLPLFRSDIVALVGEASPFARQRRISREQYLTASHVSLTPSGSLALNPIDNRLGELGLHRQVTVSVPDYASVPFVVEDSDLVFSTSRQFAEEIAAGRRLAVVDLPPDFGAIAFYCLWHERSHRSPSHQWLRAVIREAARAEDGPALRAARAG